MRKYIQISILEVRNRKLYVAGNVPNFLGSNREHIYISDNNGSKFPLSPVKAAALDKAATETTKAKAGFFFEQCLSLHGNTEFRFMAERKNEKRELIPRFGKFSRLQNFEGAGFSSDGFIITNNGNRITVKHYNPIRVAVSSHNVKKHLSKKAPHVLEIRKQAIKLKKDCKPIWLISDRSDSAGDNGEAFFEYLMKDPDETGAKDKFDIRFIISSDSPDYERMKAIGSVVDAGSDAHKVFYLASDRIISSSADEWVRNPLGTDILYCRDLVSSRYVFLQHGVIKDDLSGWLHRCNKNLSIFITSARKEWLSICKGNYGYDEDVVKLTGLARYDKLNNNSKNHVAILPTWRLYAAAPLSPQSSTRPYSKTFRETEYFKFYNRLINDSRLTDCLSKAGYSATFYLHPNHMNQQHDFEGNGIIEVWDGVVPFTKVFNESALLITDYSSVAIDFAYLGKPVIYTQFDKEKFFSSHSYAPGYYDYEKDGFGPVCTDYETSVETIIETIKNGCKEPPIYQQRVDDFFAFCDRHNCRRIYKEVIKL